MVRSGARRTALAVGVLALLAAGCGVPIAPSGPDPDRTDARGADSTDGEDVDRLEPIDVRTGELTDALNVLAARVEEARGLLLAGEDAVGALLGPGGGGEVPGVLPTVTPDRAGAATDDLVTALITLASDVGGERGRLVLELVRDPMLGDLGAWQRDPVGVIDGLRAVADDATASLDPDSLDAALAASPGELTRALGYALVASATDDPDLAAHAAAQGAGRLSVVVIALELAVERLDTDA